MPPKKVARSSKPAKKPVARKSVKTSVRKGAKKPVPARRPAASSARLAGLDAQIFKTASAVLPRKSPLLAVIRQYGVSAQGVIQAATVVEHAVRAKVRTPVSNFADALATARTSGAISDDAFHMATRLRHIRNGFAHDGHPIEASKPLMVMAILGGAMALYYLGHK